jgi:hypothetical protein
LRKEFDEYERKKGLPVHITLLFCAIITTTVAADPIPRKALHPTFRTRAAIFNLCAYLQVMACILIGPIAAYICAISNTAVL